MKAVYVLLLLALVGIVCAKATLDRAKEPSHSKHPPVHSGKHDEDDEHGDGHDGGHDGGHGDGHDGGHDNGHNGGNGDNGGIGLITLLLKFVCSLLGNLLHSLGLGGLCKKF